MWTEIPFQSVVEGDENGESAVLFNLRNDAGAAIHHELVLNAVLMAGRQRRPRGTLIHSDQGTQYGCDAWRRFCVQITSSRA